MASISSKVVALKETVQVVTNQWVPVGNQFNAGNNDILVVRPSITIKSSQDVRFRLIERASVSASTAYTLPLETLAATGGRVTLEPRYYEYNTDVNQNLIFKADVKGLDWLELQVQAGTVGATGASLNSVYYNFVKEG